MRRFPSEELSENEAVAQDGASAFEMGLGSISYFGLKKTEMGKIQGWAIFQSSLSRIERLKVLYWLMSATQGDKTGCLAPRTTQGGPESAFRQEETKIAAGVMESKNSDTTEEPQLCPPTVTPDRQLAFSFTDLKLLKLICTFYSPSFLRYKQKNTL